MKYVILKRQDGWTEPVFCVAPTTHIELAELNRARGVPVSAGFCEFLPGGAVRTFGRSDSLRLEPAVADGPLIEALCRATRKMAEPAWPVLAAL